MFFSLKLKSGALHEQPLYIWISEPGQPFRSQFVLYRTDIGLIKQTINRTSQCNKVDAVWLYASYRLNLHLLNGQRCVTVLKIFFKLMVWRVLCIFIMRWGISTLSKMINGHPAAVENLEFVCIWVLNTWYDANSQFYPCSSSKPLVRNSIITIYSKAT